MVAEANAKKMGMKNLVMWGISIGLPLIILMIPTGVFFTAPIRLFFALTLCGILLFTFENVAQIIPAIALPLAYIIFGIAPASAVLEPWSSFVVWAFLGGLIFFNVLLRNGLLDRMTYWCILKTGCSYKGILWGLLLLGFVFALAIPGIHVSIIIAILTYGICNVLQFGKSKESAGIMLMGACAALLPSMAINVQSISMMASVDGSLSNPLNLGFFDYIKHNVPTIVWCILITFVIFLMFKPTQPIEGKDYFQAQYKKLGKITMDEKKSIAVMLLLVAFLLTGNGFLHSMELGWGFAIFPLLLFLPGLNVGKVEDVQKVNFSFVLFVAACLAIGPAAYALGLGRAMTHLTILAMPILVSMSSIFALVFVYSLCFLLNFMMTPSAIMVAMAVPLASLQTSLGIDPLAVYYTVLQAVDQIILPYESASYLIFFSFGLIKISDFVKFMSLKTMLNFFFVFLIMVPYWRFIDLL